MRPREDVLADYRLVLSRIYEPRAYFGRVRRVARELDLSQFRLQRPFRHLLRDLRSFRRLLWQSGVKDREVRLAYWRTLWDCLLHNPRALHYVASQTALFLHLKPYARRMDERLRLRISESDGAPRSRPVARPA
jgi:hypothetical protein